MINDIHFYPDCTMTPAPLNQPPVQNPCPCCGYCPACGRRNYPTYEPSYMHWQDTDNGLKPEGVTSELKTDRGAR